MQERTAESLAAVLIAGNAHLSLAEDVAAAYGHPLAKATVGRFADGEVMVDIGENLRQRHVFLLQPTCAPVNENIMELLILADACRRASAKSITAVIPYFGYSRQERKSMSRSPISAKLVMDMLVTAGVNRVLSVDLHAPQIQGFTNAPVDNLYALPLFAQDIQQRYSKGGVLLGEGLVIVSPDVGGTRRARALGQLLGCPIAVIDKRRDGANQSKVLHVVGDVAGKTCLLFDDMVDTAGTLCNAAHTLVHEKGAKQVAAYATHGVLSGPALTFLAQAPLLEVVLTNTIPPKREGARANIRYLSIAPLLAEAMHRIITGASLSGLFLYDGQA